MQVSHDDPVCPVLSASNVQGFLSRLPHSQLATVVLKVERRAGSAVMMGPSAGPLTLPTSQSAQKPYVEGYAVQRRRLIPVWCNSACLQTLHMQSYRDYTRVLQRLAARDPLLQYVLQKTINQLHAGRTATPTLHVTADPLALIPSLTGIRIHGAWWQEEGTVRACMHVHAGG